MKTQSPDTSPEAERVQIALLLHFDTMLKVDVFIPKTRPYDEVAFQRIQKRLSDESELNLAIVLASPEDTVLAKLEWYKMGGEISDRQWNDILGILKVQENSLDLAYLRHWAPSLGVADLLAHALTDAGMSDEAPPPSPAL